MYFRYLYELEEMDRQEVLPENATAQEKQAREALEASRNAVAAKLVTALGASPPLPYPSWMPLAFLWGVEVDYAYLDEGSHPPALHPRHTTYATYGFAFQG